MIRRSSFEKHHLGGQSLDPSQKAASFFVIILSVEQELKLFQGNWW